MELYKSFHWYSTTPVLFEKDRCRVRSKQVHRHFLPTAKYTDALQHRGVYSFGKGFVAIIRHDPKEFVL
ncbi:MAG TPA: hypothetical protein VHO90_16340, partial [Bacteroidales bacterium]|nr:hypothetical protein [Bacteroidales bacterium]